MGMRAWAGRSGGATQCRAFCANSAFVTGCGAVRFTGPCRVSLPSACMIAATSSTSAIHDIHCLPLPCFPPSPSLNGNSRRLSTPPCAASTMPLRIITVRTPASLAGWVSASHALQMPGEEVVAERAVFGDGIVAHAVDTDGRSRHEHGAACARGSRSRAAMTAVPRTRLSRMRAFCSSVQRRSPMPSPARCTTASTPSNAGASMRLASGSQPMSSPSVTPPRRNRNTRCPLRRSSAPSARPISPLAPLITTSIRGHATIRGLHERP